MDASRDGLIQFSEFLDMYGAAFSPVPQNVAQQIHLALTGDPTEMRVTWVTKSAISNPVVLYDGRSSSGTSSTYSEGTFVPWIGWVHTAVMTGLKPGTSYSYQVSADGVVPSDPNTFRTESPWWTTNTPEQAQIAVYGDMGTVMPFGFQTAFRIVQDNHVSPYNLVVHAGDIAYAGTGKTWEFEFFWDLFFRQIEPYAAKIPYMAAVGNHEHYFNYTSYLTRFQMPSAHSGGFKNFWLSFDHTYVHWVFMSTEHDYKPGSDQYKWLEQDLAKANANRAQRPWIFLVGHRPMFCSTTSEWVQHSPGASFQANIEPLMLKYGVDVYWSGHEHLYERTWPTKNGTVPLTYSDRVYRRPGIPTHIVQGNAGAFVGTGWVQPRPSWSAFREQQYGYGRLTINATAFHYEFISTNIDAVRDEFWLIR